MVDFAKRVILITGAGRGLGFAYARYLGERGATVLLQDAGADSNGGGEDQAVVEEAARLLRAEGFDAIALSGSIASREECRGLVAEAMAIHGHLDGLIHNAGWVAYETIESLQEDSFDHMMNTRPKRRSGWHRLHGPR